MNKILFLGATTGWEPGALGTLDKCFIYFAKALPRNVEIAIYMGATAAICLKKCVN